MCCLAVYRPTFSEKSYCFVIIANGTEFLLPFSPVITFKTFVLEWTHSVCLVVERPLTGIWLIASCGTGILPGKVHWEAACPPTPAGGLHYLESIVLGYGTPPLMLSRTDILPLLESGSDHHSIMQLLQDTDQGKVMRLLTQLACKLLGMHMAIAVPWGHKLFQYCLRTVRKWFISTL